MLATYGVRLFKTDPIRCLTTHLVGQPGLKALPTKKEEHHATVRNARLFESDHAATVPEVRNDNGAHTHRAGRVWT
jgi:hypothetical protein